MGKLSKEQIQKIAASVLILGFLIYGYFAFLINPVKEKMAEAEIQIEELRGKVKTADTQILKTTGLEEEATKATDTLDNMQVYFPEGAPIAWFPPMTQNFFKMQGIEDISTKQIGSAALGNQALSGFGAETWNIQLMNTDFIKAAIAIAGLENEQPFLEITELRVEQSPEVLGQQRITLAVKMLTKERR